MKIWFTFKFKFVHVKLDARNKLAFPNSFYIQAIVCKLIKFVECVIVKPTEYLFLRLCWFLTK